MEIRGTGLRRHRRRRTRPCEAPRADRAPLLGRGRGAEASDPTGLAARTAMRAVVAAGAYVAQDMRDREGLTRPMLRRAAIRMAVSRQTALRRLGAAYLRADPPAPEELPEGVTPPGRPLPPGDAEQVIDVDPSTVTEAGPEEG